MGAPAVSPLVIGCGVLEPELRRLAAAGGPGFDLALLPAALHLDPDRLARALGAQLARTASLDARVFYGVCHPGLERLVQAHGRRRIRGLNCVEMLLGAARYREELEAGSYFLLEAWAQGFEAALVRTFGGLALAAEVFQGAHTRLLAIRTPCSGDFSAAAEAASRAVGLPLAWTTVELDHLAAVLRELLAPEGVP